MNFAPDPSVHSDPEIEKRCPHCHPKPVEAVPPVVVTRFETTTFGDAKRTYFDMVAMSTGRASEEIRDRRRVR